MLFYVYAFFTGLILGSFYQVVACRIPLGSSIIKPRSHCLHCHHVLQVKELIPILSFCIQKGRCTNCNIKISPFHPLFEGIAGIGFLLTALFIGPNEQLIIVWTLLSLLFIVTITDLLYMVIPNRILFFFAGLFVIERFFISPSLWWDGLLGAAVMFGLLYIIQVICPAGIGGGDVKLLILLGFVVGTKTILLSLCFSSLFGICFFTISIAFRCMTYKQPLPFAPFIALGTICAYSIYV
ncbi:MULTISPECIES: prepilin peptidase [unclassified Bacillus (in: firmicutes)]|uniref:prepilin peptidase n=1 Tax=unclassified Bacillus (in: firmicutes) TaxID=185979 RepID=UPI003D1E7541